MKFIFVILFPLLLLPGCQRKTAAVTEDFKGDKTMQPVETKSAEKTKTNEINSKATRVQQDLEHKETPIQSSGSQQETLIKNQEQPDYKSLYESGYQKHNAGDFSGAIADFSKCISLNPQYADAWNFRAQSKYKSGDKTGACTDWNRAKELGYVQAERAINLYCK